MRRLLLRAAVALAALCVLTHLAYAAPERSWNERPLTAALWLMNIGLLLRGYGASLQTLCWPRVIGDSLSVLGALAFMGFAASLLRSRSQPSLSPERSAV